MYKKIIKGQRLKFFARRLTKRMQLLLDGFVNEYPDLLPQLPQTMAIRFARGIGGPWDVGLRNNGGGLDIVIPFEFERAISHEQFEHLFNYVVLFIKAGPEVEAATFHLCDGGSPSVAQFAASSVQPEVTLLPNRSYLVSLGYRDLRKTAALLQNTWDERSDNIVWRGLFKGVGSLDPYAVLASNEGTCQRLRLAHLAKGTDVDFKFSGVDLPLQNRVIVQRSGFSGEDMASETWADRKYAIDVDGYGSSSSNLIECMITGCCVLKVESQFGFRQWFYDRLIPFEHFVPVRADLSDFWDQCDWVKSNPGHAKKIARNAQRMAFAIKFDTEIDAAADTIRKEWAA